MLLFLSLCAFFTEPLAAAVRQNKNFKGIQCDNSKYKSSLYADDLLLFLQEHLGTGDGDRTTDPPTGTVLTPETQAPYVMCTLSRSYDLQTV